MGANESDDAAQVMALQLTYQIGAIVGIVVLIVWADLLLARNIGGRSAAGFFFGGNRLHWTVLGAALFVSAFWGMILIAKTTPATIARGDMMIPVFAIAGGLILLGFVFVRTFARTGARSLASYLTARYGRPVGLLVAIAWVSFAVLIRIPFTIFVGTRLLHAALQWDLIPGGLLLVVLPGLLIVARGYIGVLITHSLAALMLLTTVSAGLFLGLPGWVAGTFSDPSLVPLGSSALIIGSVILGVWHSCVDQISAHHAIAAGNGGTVRRGAILGAVAIVAVSIVVVSLSVQAAPGRAPAGEQGIMTVLIGMTTLLLAVASLGSHFMAIATLVGIDMYQPSMPGKDDASIVLVSRTVTAVVVIGAILAGTTVGVMGIDRTDWLIRALGAGVPPLTAVVLIGVVWRRIHGRGALWALVAGWSVGAAFVVFIAESVEAVALGMIATFAVAAFTLIAVSMAVSPESMLRGFSESLVEKGLQSRKS